MAVNEVSTFESQDIGMVQLRREPHLAREIVQRLFGYQSLVRNFQRNVHALECIERAKHSGIRPIGKPRAQLVFANLLSRLEHGEKGSGFGVQGSECSRRISVCCGGKRRASGSSFNSSLRSSPFSMRTHS